MPISSVLLGNEKESGVIDVLLDYSIPAYRDCSVGTYLYSKLPSKGIRSLEYHQAETEEHVAYMKKMGFVKSANAYVRNLK